MHRDVKPGNIMINPNTKKPKLVDWGHAEYFIFGTEQTLRIGSGHYKSPELLSNMRIYDYSLDVWALGCVYA